MARLSLTAFDLNGNELRSFVVHPLSSDPGSPVEGQMWYNTTDNVLKYRGDGVTISLAAASGLDQEAVEEIVNAMFSDTATIDFTYTDNGAGAGTITVDVKNDSITYAKLQNVSATDRLLGRDTAAAGDVEELTVGGGVEFTGSGGIQTSAFTGDVTKAAGGTATTIANDAVTYAKMQDVSATDRLLGRDTAGSGNVEELTVGGGVEFTGSTGIQRSALTGDVTAAAGSNTTAIAAGVIVDADVNASAAIAATKLAFTPAQGVAATNVQAAIEEVVTDLTASITAATEGKAWKDPVRVATTAAGTLATSFENGDTVDGVTLITGDRILLKDQAAGAENGIYTVNASGAPTRAADMSTAAEANNATVLVEAGTANAGDTYTQTANIVTLGTTAMTWVKSGEGNTVYSADGTTLTLTGSTFSITNAGVGATQLAAAVAGNGLAGGAGTALSVNTDGTTLEISSDAVRIAATAAGAGLTGGGGSALAVGAGTGVTVNANDVAIDTSVVVRKYSVALAGGATSEVITHNLGTRNVQVVVRDNNSPYASVIVDDEATTTNTVTIRAASNLPAGYIVTVVG